MKTPEHVWFKLLGTKVSHKAALKYINKQNFQELDLDLSLKFWGSYV